MAVVDFTLADIAAQTEQIVERALVREREHTLGMFAKERENTKKMIQDSAEDVKQSITAEFVREFMSFIDDNFDPAIESLQSQISEVRRDMKKMRVVVD